ncbi:MAG: SDR family oxidoreductase [Gluconacetobacter diazotrophicus]|nr:SDR family oxidoreductase [Gluconacetobacter diazotrophicus]
MADRSTALVSGANKGIGLEIARGLGRLGYRVWLGSRDPERGAAAAAELRRGDIDARPLRLDVADDASVAAAAESLAGETDRLDVLVNNAGISLGWNPPSEDTVANVRAIYEVNVFGVVRTTLAFLPLLRASAVPRVVMISSSLGSLAWASNADAPMSHVNLLGYNSSKSALNAVTLAFAKELGPLGFKVNAGCPGYTATDLNGHQGPRTTAQGAAIGAHLATLPADGPNGGFFDDDGIVAW